MFVLAGAAPTATSAQQQPTATPSLVFAGVTVVDVEQGKLIPDQEVVVTHNRIQAVGAMDRIKAPEGAQVVDARGKYLIPGLWDMHVHVGDGDLFDSVAAQDSLYRKLYPRLIAHGITGIREMGQRFSHGSDSFRVWQREVMAGSRVGPRAIGPSDDVSGEGSARLETPDQTKHVVDSLKAAGDAFVKFHGNPDDADIFFALLREARRVGLPVVGHVPAESVTEVEAVDSGMRSIEHAQGGGPRDCWNLGSELPDSVTLEQACVPVVKAYIRNGTWFTPTLVFLLSEAIRQRAAKRFAELLQYVRTIRRLGLTNVLAGSDWVPSKGHGLEFLPGLSAAEELVFLVEAGLTPVEALQAATLNPARFLNATDSLGTVAAGKLADLVLLDADPLTDVAHVLKVRAVVANGRYFDRSALDTMDPEGTKPGRGMLVVQEQLKASSAAPSP